MQRLFFEKQIDLNHALQALLSVSVHENLAYQDDNEGKRAVGNLEIDGDYLCGGQKEHFHDQIEMDVLAPFDRLEDEETFHLEVQDFDYHIQNGNLNLEIQVMAHGVGEKKERHIIVDSADEDEQALLEEIQNIISKKELVDTLEEHLQEAAEPDTEAENQEILLEDDKQTEAADCLDEEEKRTEMTDEEEVISEKPSDIALEDEEIPAAKMISEDFAEAEQTAAPTEAADALETEAKETAVKEAETQAESVQPDLPAVEDWQDNDSVDVEDLFDDDDMAFVTYPIYVVQAGDTYQSIADRYDLEAEDLMDYNHHMSLQPHQLLVIPPR